MAGDTGAPGFIPLYDDDTSFAPIQVPFNGISQAMNTALKRIAFTTYATLATLNLPANVGTVVGQHATVNADSTALNNGDYVWNGTAWKFFGIGAFATYTATLVNITLGNGTATARARREGERVRVRFDLAFGSTTVMGAIPQVSLPVTAVLSHPFEYFGEATGWDVSATTPWLMGVLAANASTTNVQIVPNNSGAIASTVNGAAPFGWATGDHLSFDISYQAA